MSLEATYKRLLEEKRITTGNLYDTGEKIVIVIDIDNIDDYDWLELGMYTSNEDIQLFHDNEVIHLSDGYYYLIDGGNYLPIEKYVIGMADIKKGNYNFQDIINYYINNESYAIPNRFYEELKKYFEKKGFKKVKKTFYYNWVKDALEGYPEVDWPPKVFDEYRKKGCDVVFVANANYTHESHFQNEYFTLIRC